MWWKTFSAVLVAALLAGAGIFTMFKIDKNADRAAANWAKDAAEWARLTQEARSFESPGELKRTIDAAESVLRRAPERADPASKHELEWRIRLAKDDLVAVAAKP